MTVLFPAELCREWLGGGRMQAENVTTAHVQPHHDADEHPEDCSELCVCSGGVQTLEARQYSIGINTTVEPDAASPTASEYADPQSSNHPHSIWQPPKA